MIARHHARPRRLALALAIATAPACRCNDEETLAPVELGADEESAAVSGGGVLAPAWRAIERDGLDNGALMDWLTEPGSPVFQVRVVLPTSTRAQKLDAASVAVLSTTLLGDLTLRMRAQRAGVALEHAPGRVELVIRGRAAEGDAILTALGEALGSEPASRRLDAALKKQLALHRTTDPIAVASAVLIAEVLGLPRAHLHAAQSELESLTSSQLARTFKTLTDPDHALVIVHAGVERETHAVGIEAMTQSWRGSWLRPNRRKVSARLRARPPRFDTGGRVLGSPPAPMRVVTSIDPAPRGSAVVIGRAIPLATPLDRSRARAAQRVLQEDYDARLAVAGEVGVLVIRVPVSRKDPLGSLTKTIDRLEQSASVPVRGDRLRQAAELWLGGRVVAASLAEEDWTRLWSESIDLATDDSDVSVALGRDARTMLEMDPAGLQEWQARWMAPRSGEPGWFVVLAGADETMLGAFAGLGTIEER